MDKVLENPLSAGAAQALLPQPCVLVIFGAAGYLAWRKLLPAVYKVHFASTRTDRRINVLRTVEAIRLYAAAHGQLPSKLDDLEVPVPTDPVTGKAFEYRLAGDKALLTGPTPAGERPHESNTLRYEITLRR